MSLPIVLATVLFILYLSALFGRFLPAARSVNWWLFLLFLLVAAISPRLFEPLAHTLGVKFVSNLVLATTCMFLLLQLVIESVAQFRTSNLCRLLVCSDAAKSFRGQPRADTTEPRVLVILPCYNEEASIPALVPRLEELASSYGLDFCFVNDSSSDSTAAVLQRLAPEHYVTHVQNMSVSGALLTGFLIARRLEYAYVVQCDSDGQHPVESIPDLVHDAVEHHADVTIGSRFCRGWSWDRLTENTTSTRRLGSLVLVFCLRLLFPRTVVTDPTSGFRVYSQRAMRLLLEHMPERYPEPETIALAVSKGLTVREVPVSMSQRQGGMSSLHGMKTAVYMVRVLSALLGLRLRALASAFRFS